LRYSGGALHDADQPASFDHDFQVLFKSNKNINSKTRRVTQYFSEPEAGVLSLQVSKTKELTTFVKTTHMMMNVLIIFSNQQNYFLLHKKDFQLFPAMSIFHLHIFYHFAGHLLPQRLQYEALLRLILSFPYRIASW
jgi:hypothetical protein